MLVTGYFGGYSTEPGDLAAAELAAAGRWCALVRGQSKPVVVHTIFPRSPGPSCCAAARVPVHRDLDRACAVLAGLVARPAGARWSRCPRLRRPVTEASYDGARALFAVAGVAVAAEPDRARLVRSWPRRCGETGFPVVLKALGSVHKSDGGGVVLGLADAPAALAAYDDLRVAAGPARGLGGGHGRTSTTGSR